MGTSTKGVGKGGAKESCLMLRKAAWIKLLNSRELLNYVVVFKSEERELFANKVRPKIIFAF